MSHKLKAQFISEVTVVILGLILKKQGEQV